MFLKKGLILSSILATLSCSSLVLADDGLTTINNTDYVSTVRLLSGKYSGSCTGALPAPLPSQYTNAHDSSTVHWILVGLLCSNSPGNICKAEIHMTQQCTGAPVATVELNLNNKSIQTVNNLPNTGFNISAEGSRVYLNPI